MSIMENRKYVAYYRVSTQKQGQSGLGLEGQQQYVKNFTKDCRDCVIAEFIEVESGRKDNRAELNKAIKMAKDENAILLIAKLDRLARRVSFITTLRDTGVKFVACDNPEATNLVVNVLASFAEEEARVISERTKAALDAKKARLKALGQPENWRTGKWNNEAREKGIKTIKENAAINENTKKAKRLAEMLRKEGKTFEQIANILNEDGQKTARGKAFDKALVKYLIEK
jgi:DNA invertase Pin-like site-specific DNA recombinase